jgi:ATP-dependent helicase/nuclease subunit A
MSAKQKGLHQLIEAQMEAVEPQDNIWLSASAGTGKTQVLTARVIRLLLEEEVKPENILCITFTKAGATEMSERINGLLASWVQMDNKSIFNDLEAIGAVSGPEARQKASRLFAKVLDAPGGGLQILTIHSLCQSMLGSFPEEAGLVPGFKPVEGREQEELYREALSEMIVMAEQGLGNWILEYLQTMSLSMGEEAALKFLRRCASQPSAIEIVPEDDGAVIFARRLVGVNFAGTAEEFMANACADSMIDLQSIRAIAEMNAAWGTKTGMTRAENISIWLALPASERATQFDLLHSAWANKNGEIAKVVPKSDAYAHIALEMFQWSSKLTEQAKLADYAERLSKALLVGKSFSARYAKAKAERGLVDFDDMIRKTAEMLKAGGMAEWVKYKLDRQIDHILVDEAQDTNAMQWDIIKSLSDDFFSGASAKGERNRTIFSVGDYKQAIFGFQGTDPAQYEKAGYEFAHRLEQADIVLKPLILSQSFRSTRPILDFVNAVVNGAGPDRFGLTSAIEDHHGDKPDTGMIEIFAPVLAPADDHVTENSDEEETWLGQEKAILAHRLAGYVRRLVDEKPILASTGKALVAGDIMILLRSRGDLASLLVSRLHAAGVPVAGIDRLKLLEPVAVQDLMAAVRFVLQPGDDLSLACLLVSPLFGWSQEKLLAYGYRPEGHGLWEHLRGQDTILEDVASLRMILASADFTTAYQFLELILSGPLRGRRKMIARLGEESLVPIEELLNAALLFEQNHGGTLQAFLAWFESGESEVKREGLTGNSEVRILTVHGAKGLQAPVVILADVTSDPDKKPGGNAELSFEDGYRLPLLNINALDKIGRLEHIAEVQKEREKAEHMRLLYVAITRAEERLVIAGALGARSKGVATQESWYTALLAGVEALGCEWQHELPWGRVMRHIGGAAKTEEKRSDPDETESWPELPSWITTDASEESRPPKPLVPSQLGDDDYGEAPPNDILQLASQKGKLIHALFERIIGEDIESALLGAKAWLDRSNTETEINNDEIIAKIAAVLSNSDWAIFFGAQAQAEVPLAAVVGETVISGRVDRLVVEAGLVRVLDFKTGRKIPKSADELPVAYLRQMAHYVAALEAIFENHKVEASLLFTHAPQMLTLTQTDLAAYKPAC